MIFNIDNINKDKIIKKEKYIFILLDIETCNGSRSYDNAIINIAFMFIGTDYIFSSYCKPDNNITWRYLDEKQKQKHDQLILKEDVENSPILEKVLLEFNKIIHYDDNFIPIILSHNSGYESSILNYCYEYYDIKLDKVKWCNTANKEILKMAKLEKLVEDLKITKTLKFHYAENDVYFLNKCILKKYNTYNENLINKFIEISYEYDKHKKYNILIKKYENYLNTKNKNKNINIESTDFFKFLIEGKEKLDYKKEYYSKRYYRIIEFLNIDDDNFIVNSGITPIYILELRDDEYNKFMNILKNKFSVKETYNKYL
jgi:hypothetical protein